MSCNGEISVTYSGGVLLPDKPLDLPEGTRLLVALRPEAPDPAGEAKAWETIRQFRESGAFRSGGRKLTRDEMHERG